MAFAMAGCHARKLVAPPPTFDTPIVQAEPEPDAEHLPSAVEEIPNPTTQQLQQAAIKEVAADQLFDTAAVKPAVPARAWKYIIVHHSDTASGSALRFHRAHLARGWDSLGYDFVIGNGTETKDGMIEVGPRWTKQLTGAHTGTPDNSYNDFGIGICLVGNFDESRPTAKQLDSLARLCAYLMRTYDIPADRIIGHRDAKPTNCPGKHVSLDAIREAAVNYMPRVP